MAKNITNPHDKYFSAVFSYKEITEKFLHSFLPAQYLQHLNLGSLERITGSFIDENLQEHFTDMLYQCQLKNSKQIIWISLLLKHKSYNDQETDFQLLDYINGAWHQNKKDHKKRQFTLPIVLYHGDKPWVRKRISEHFGQIGQHFNDFLPKFDYVLVDLSTFSEERIHQMHLDTIILNMVMVLKFGRDKNFVINHIDRIFFRANEYYDKRTGENFFNVSFVYLLSLVETSSDNLTTIFSQLPKPIKSKAMTLYDSILKKGEQKGRQEGRQEGFHYTLEIIEMLKNNVTPVKISAKLNVDIEFIQKLKEKLGL